MKQLLIILAALFCLSGAVFAEDTYFGDFKTDTDMEIKGQGQNMFSKGVQYGGWLTPLFIYQGDSDNNYLSQSVNTLRLWFRSYLWNNASIYLRGKYTFSGTMDQNGYSEQKTTHVVDVDIAVLNMSFFDKKLTVDAGRKYFLIGSGMVLNNRADGMEVNYFSKYVNVQAFANYTGLLLKDNNPYNLRSANYSTSIDNLFTGGTLSGSYFNQTFYFIALAQMQFKDDSDGNRYDTQFYGGGSKGTIISGLTYYAEFVYQLGTFDDNGTEYDISEMGAAVELKYSLDVLTKPVFMFQYGYGSGSVEFGQTLGFVNYGTFFGGYGFNPQLHNIHILRFGFSIAPTDMVNIAWLKKTSVITKYSLYLVDDDSVQSVGSPDQAAAYGEKIAGHGLDMSFRWRIFSDLACYVTYGLFIPGSAVGSAGPDRHFAMGGLNISF